MEQEFKIPQERKKSFLISASVYFLFFIGFIILGIYVWQDPTSTSFRKYVLIPWFTFSSLYGMITNLYNGYFMKIETNKETIKFESFGIAITTNWSKLITIEDFGNIFQTNLEGISVLKSSVRKHIWGLLVQRPRYIPIHYFGNNWRRSKLGQQIKQHAPHLFVQENP